jgi:hypothetical protein
MNKFESKQRGYSLALVLIFLAMGSLLLVPMLRFTTTALQSKQLYSAGVLDQYARDAAAEFGVWQLLYGSATQTLTESDDTITSTVSLNGIDADITIKMRTELGVNQVPGAEDNTLRPSVTVECAKDGDAVFDDDCSALPVLGGMVARYTVSLEQISPDLSVTLDTVYDEMPAGFTYRTGTVASSDFPEIVAVTPTILSQGQIDIVKWDLTACGTCPITFTHGEIKTFTFEANIDNKQDRYCNNVLLKMSEAPHEATGKTAFILVGNSPPDGCDGGGVISEKYVDQLVAPPGVTTVFTYVINMQNSANSVTHIDSAKDVLPQGGFEWCDPANPPVGFTCDAPMYKRVATPFDPLVDDFASTTGFTNIDLADQTLTQDPVTLRWELFWDGPGGAGWQLSGAGGATDVMIVRFMAHVTPQASGSYFNEIFADADCSVPQVLISEGVTTSSDYCASYSWPSGGTLVPMYDVLSESDLSIGQGNVSVGAGTAQLVSWHTEFE